MWHTLKIGEVRRKLRTNLDKGLTYDEAKIRRAKLWCK